VAAKAALVPDTVRTTINRVIILRSGFGVKLEKHGKVLNEISDTENEYFIECEQPISMGVYSTGRLLYCLLMRMVPCPSAGESTRYTNAADAGR
jgi:hypothetical protein